MAQKLQWEKKIVTSSAPLFWQKTNLRKGDLVTRTRNWNSIIFPYLLNFQLN